MKSERGAVSIFIILIIVPIFLFHAVLIEFVRAKLADQQLEAAVKAALRSVGARYDRQLQTYGLYGVIKPGASTIYAQIIADHLEHGLANTRPISSSLQLSRSLADVGVFKNQVMEEMKYRAPLEYAREMTQKLQRTGLSKAMNDLAEFSSNAEDLERLRVKRDEALKRVWGLSDDWDVWISGSLTSLAQQVSSMEPHHSKMRQIDIVRLQQEKSSLELERQSLSERAETEGEAESYDVGDEDEAHGQHVDERAGQASERTEEAQAEEIQSAVEDQRIAEIERAIAELEQEIQQYQNWQQQLRELELRYDSIVIQVMKIASELLSTLAEAESYNNQLQERMNDWHSEFGGELLRTVHVIAAEDLKHIREQTIEHRDSLAAMRSAVTYLSLSDASELATRLSSYLTQWADWHQQVKQAEAEQGEREQQLRDEEEQAEKEYKRQIEHVLQLVTGCDPAKLDQEKTLYAALKERTQNDAGDVSEMEQYGDGREADDDARSIAQMIGQIGDTITESLYVGEYALVSFNHRTTSNPAGGKKQENSSLTNPEAHPLSDQEVEYVLYGFHSCSANYSAAYWEIFATRLAVRTLESLLEPKNSWRALGSPLLAFVWALAEGAVKAYQDTERLVNGEEVPLSSKLAPQVTWGYRDYLRMFMLLHGGKEDRIRRMQALIELNTGLRLSEHYTYWTGKTEGEMRSLMLGSYIYRPKVEVAWGYY